MFKLLKDFFDQLSPRDSFEGNYKMEPNEDGTYSLMRFNHKLGVYFWEDRVRTKEEALKSIANLERKTIYLDK
jgi:hypothetical protein